MRFVLKVMVTYWTGHLAPVGIPCSRTRYFRSLMTCLPKMARSNCLLLIYLNPINHLTVSGSVAFEFALVRMRVVLTCTKPKIHELLLQRPVLSTRHDLVSVHLWRKHLTKKRTRGYYSTMSSRMVRYQPLRMRRPCSTRCIYRLVTILF